MGNIIRPSKRGATDGAAGITAAHAVVVLIGLAVII